MTLAINTIINSRTFDTVTNKTLSYINNCASYLLVIVRIAQDSTTRTINLTLSEVIQVKFPEIWEYFIHIK